MKIAFNEATTLGNSTLENDLIFCQKYGYDYIEIRQDKLIEFLSEHTVNDLKRFFELNRIKAYAFDALECITFRDEEGFHRIEEDLHFLCETGKQIGCSKIIVHPTFDIGDYSREVIKSETVRVLRLLSDLAEPYGVSLALEFAGYPNCSVNTFGQAYEIVQAANRDNVGIVLDCFHFYGTNSQIDDVRKADPRKIFAVHMSDSEDVPTAELRDYHRVWPDLGVIDLDLILATLKEIGYNEMVSVELLRPEYWEWDAERTIETGKQTTENAVRRHFSN